MTSSTNSGRLPGYIFKSRRTQNDITVRKSRGPAVMWAISVLGFIVLLAPSMVILAAGLTKDSYLSFPPAGFSLRWLKQFVTGPLLVSYGFSFGLALVASIVATVLGTLAALSVTRGILRRFPSSRAIFMAPLTVPGVILGFALYIFYVGSGIGLTGTYLGLLIGHVIIVMPYIVGSLSAALAGMERSLEDAARSLGAGPWRTFRSVTLPLISPGMIAGIVFAFVVSFGQFDVSLFLSTPDLEPLPIALYQQMRFQFDPTIAASGVFAVIQLVVLLLIINHVFGLSRLTKSLLR